jgi:hypothetical protein
MRRTPHAAIALVFALAALGGLAACGGETGQSTTTIVRKVIVKKHVGHPPRTRDPGPQTGTTTPGYTYCDSNISVKTATTSCQFGENVFYEYWSSGESSSVTAYSPATGSTYAMQCTSGAEVDCTNSTEAEVRFAAAAVDAYTPGQAADYAKTHELGPGGSANSDDAAGSATSSGPTNADFCSSHDCIESFDEGQGYIVKCEDGEWSHSGGLPGACSWHGGETEITAR